MTHADTSARNSRVVILGGGFGGVYVMRRLRRLLGASARITLVSRENYFLFTPLLHEVATGGLSPETIIEPFRRTVIGPDSPFVLGEARLVDLERRLVETTAGELPYDRLVIALGSDTNFYGTPGAAEHAFTLKDLDDAVRLKNHVIGAFERAAMAPSADERRALLTFAVVGGGPTGVELAAEMADLINGTLAAVHGAAVVADARVVLLQSEGELLSSFSPHFRSTALASLAGRGVEVRLGAKVVSVDAAGLALEDGTRIDASAVVWVAGVAPAALAFSGEVERDRGGRLLCEPTLRLKGRPEVYALGDIASIVPAGAARPLPPFAQVAVAQSSTVAENLARSIDGRPPRPFAYRHRGDLLSLGQWMAVAEIGRFRFAGHFAWWLWRTIYLTKFISWPKKFAIALQWTINLFYPRDISRL